jgi:hypothetical protein
MNESHRTGRETQKTCEYVHEMEGNLEPEKHGNKAIQENNQGPSLDAKDKDSSFRATCLVREKKQQQNKSKCKTDTMGKK